jgi:hypothetical protein
VEAAPETTSGSAPWGSAGATPKTRESPAATRWPPLSLIRATCARPPDEDWSAQPVACARERDGDGMPCASRQASAAARRSVDPARCEGERIRAYFSDAWQLSWQLALQPPAQPVMQPATQPVVQLLVQPPQTV